MTQFVIRSMSTTDAGAGPITPYHVYLLEAAKRAGAYWQVTMIHAAKFDSVEEAQAEADRSKLSGSYDIVPTDFAAQGLPDFWNRAK